MADVKDILGLTKNVAAGGLAEKKKTFKDLGQKKPDGISREVYALTGGIPPIMPTLDPLGLKKKRQSSKKVQWRWQRFSSSARVDNLELSHWEKVVDGVPPSGDYPFAKYNKLVDLVSYSDEEYSAYLQDPNWSREETDHLFEMCSRFDLRFIIIADRYEDGGQWPTRTVEQLKDRYYKIARTLTLTRAPSPEDVADNLLVKDPYNAEYETERKAALHALFSATKTQLQEEKDVLAEAERILEARKAAASSAKPAEPPAPAVVPPPPKETPRPTPIPVVTPPMHQKSPQPLHSLPRVYTRGKRLQQQVISCTSGVGSRQVKRIEQMLEELNLASKAETPTKHVCEEYLALRKELANTFLLQKKLQMKQQELVALRENPLSEAPSTPNTPKSQRLQRGGGGGEERISTRGAGPSTGGPAEVSADGERSSKRSDKQRKAPARFNDGQPSPPKRNRKLKGNED